MRKIATQLFFCFGLHLTKIHFAQLNEFYIYSTTVENYICLNFLMSFIFEIVEADELLKVDVMLYNGEH